MSSSFPAACLAFAPPTPLVWVAWALLALLLAFVVWLRRSPRFHGKRFFVLANAGLAAWLGGASLEMLVPDPACKMLYASLTYGGIALVPAAWAFFLFRYAYGISGPMRPGHRAALIGGPVAAVAMAVTSPWHGLFYGPGSAPIGGVPGAPLLYEHGPLFYIVALWLYGCLGAGFVLLGIGWSRARPDYRRHFAVLFVLAAVPVAGNVGYILFDAAIAGFDPTPFLFSAILTAYLWMISTGTVFEVTALARRLIFDALPNPVLVVGEDGGLLGWNPSAVTVFGPHVGDPGRLDALPGGDVLAAALRRGAANPPNLALGARHYEPQVTEIMPPVQQDGRRLGWVVMLVDITDEVEQRKAAEASLSLERARAGALERAAARDPLTGLLNRRSLEAEYLWARAEGATLALAIMDLDHFKQINDRFGHATGDAVLTGTARALQRAFRAQDRLFRYGGEEFLVLCPGMTGAALADRLEAMRAPLAQMPEVAEIEGLRVGFSAGTATAPDEAPTLDALIALADTRLYAAKAAGRGRIATG